MYISLPMVGMQPRVVKNVATRGLDVVFHVSRFSDGWLYEICISLGRSQEWLRLWPPGGQMLCFMYQGFLMAD